MTYRFGFVMEQTLGQITHTQNFQASVGKDPEVIATWIPIFFEAPDQWNRTPVIRNNWTLRASLRARAQMHDVLRSQKLDVLFFHTQVTALFAHRMMTKIPTIVSMDATPLNFDTIGPAYAHTPSGFRQVEAIKNALTRRTFRRAKRLVVWHHWGKASLVKDYGAHPDKVDVVPPGIDLERWNFPRVLTEGPLRLLFVGGDFKRKGGETLLQAFRAFLAPHCSLDIVTRDAVNVEGLSGVRVHRGLRPNTPELMRLYAEADVFVFPTLADALPLAIMEAMAAGLPVITTNVGAINEEVEDGRSGFLLPPGDVTALAEATLRLVRDPGLRMRMSGEARRTADEKFNGSTNYRQLLDICKQCVEPRRTAQRDLDAVD